MSFLIVSASSTAITNYRLRCPHRNIHHHSDVTLSGFSPHVFSFSPSLTLTNSVSYSLFSLSHYISLSFLCCVPLSLTPSVTPSLSLSVYIYRSFSLFLFSSFSFSFISIIVIVKFISQRGSTRAQCDGKVKPRCPGCDHVDWERHFWTLSTEIKFAHVSLQQLQTTQSHRPSNMQLSFALKENNTLFSVSAWKNKTILKVQHLQIFMHIISIFAKALGVKRS